MVKFATARYQEKKVMLSVQSAPITHHTVVHFAVVVLANLDFLFFEELLVRRKPFKSMSVGRAEF